MRVLPLQMSEQYYAEIRDVYRNGFRPWPRRYPLDGAFAYNLGAFYAMLELPVDDADRFARFM